MVIRYNKQNKLFCLLFWTTKSNTSQLFQPLKKSQTKNLESMCCKTILVGIIMHPRLTVYFHTSFPSGDLNTQLKYVPLSRHLGDSVLKNKTKRNLKRDTFFFLQKHVNRNKLWCVNKQINAYTNQILGTY